MKKREGKIPITTLLLVTLFAVLLITIELSIKIRRQAPSFTEKIAASQHTAQAFQAIRLMVDSLRIPIDPVNDPNRTGLIGRQFSPLTTERGDLQAKLTATNPNVAAMIIHLLRHAHIHKNDMVAVYMTGSTPALNIATLVALETIGATPIIVTSVGSAMWGANYPELTMLDMERILFERSLLKSRTSHATLGGHDETGRGLSPEGRALIDTSIQRNRIAVLTIHDIREAINQIAGVFDNNAIKAFINITEQPTALSGYDLQPGIIQPYSVKEGTGLIPHFSQQGVTVINLTQINYLAQKYALPIAPISLPAIGEGQLYYEYCYSVILAVIFLLLLCIVLFFMLQYDIDALIRRRNP